MSRRTARIALSIATLGITGCIDLEAPQLGDETSPLYGGTEALPGELPAVGYVAIVWPDGETLPSFQCSATLIADDLVLTAAHCLCISAYDCQMPAQGWFVLEDVPRVDDPSTKQDESATTGAVVLPGRYVMHPDYLNRFEGDSTHMSHDLAVLRLWDPASSLTTVEPMALAPDAPQEGAVMTLVGLGRGGTAAGDCAASAGIKRYGQSHLDDVEDRGFAGLWLHFESEDLHLCPGDSGGPVLDGKQRVAGVASYGTDGDNSYYGSTWGDREWLGQQFGTPNNRFRMWTLGSGASPGNCDELGLASHTYCDVSANPMMIGFHDTDDLRFVGDFMDTGTAQGLFINRGNGDGRVMITDFLDNVSPNTAMYYEYDGESTALNGWHQAEDSQVVGDFMGVKHDQLLMVNRGGGPGLLTIADFSDGAAPVEPLYTWLHGQDPLLNGWLDPGDRMLVGDFCKRGHDQLMLINQAGTDGRILVVDFSGGAVPADVCYYEGYDQATMLGAWHDAEDRIIAGDFRGDGWDQVMFINTDGIAGHVLIADFHEGYPAMPRYLEGWGESSFLDGWTDPEDTLIAADFFDEGHDTLLAVEQTAAPFTGGGRLLVGDYSDGKVPAALRYVMYAGMDTEVESRLDPDDGVFVGRFRWPSGQPQILTVERY